MKFSIIDPIDNTPLLLNVMPAEYEGQPALKVVFPEMDSITMIKKNEVWLNAAPTDISPELIKAISLGIQSRQCQQENKSILIISFFQGADYK